MPVMSRHEAPALALDVAGARLMVDFTTPRPQARR